MVIYNDDIDDNDGGIDDNDDGGNDDNDDDNEFDNNGDDNDTKFKDPNVFIVERAVDKRTKVIYQYMSISTTQLISYMHRGASLSIYCYGKAIPKKMLLGWSLHM